MSSASIYTDAQEYGLFKTYVGSIIMCIIACSLFCIGILVISKASKINSVNATVIDSIDCVTSTIQSNNSVRNVVNCNTTLKYSIANIEYTKQLITPQYSKGTIIPIYYETDPNNISLTSTSSGVGICFMCLCSCSIIMAIAQVYFTKKFRFLAAGNAVSGVMGGGNMSSNLGSGLVGGVVGSLGSGMLNSLGSSLGSTLSNTLSNTFK